MQEVRTAGQLSAVHLDGTLNDPGDRDLGWSVELAIPWAAFADGGRTAVPPPPGSRWRVNFSRVQWDLDVAGGGYLKRRGSDGKPLPEHNWVWSPQGVIDMHRPERWGYVQFTSVRDGKAEFVKDPDWAVKDELHRAYYAQRDIRAKTGPYAA